MWGIVRWILGSALALGVLLAHAWLFGVAIQQLHHGAVTGFAMFTLFWLSGLSCANFLARLFGRSYYRIRG
jgi:hypothetical protein